MSPAAAFLTQAGFTRVGAVRSLRGFDVWHLSTAGAPDIAVAIPDHDSAQVDWAVRGIFDAGELAGKAAIREHWLRLHEVMATLVGHIGVGKLPDAPEHTTGLETDDQIPL